VKIAIQSARDFADDPAKVLKHLAHIIGPQLQGQFITAAYIFIDLAEKKARYSAAGHPPLFHIEAAHKKINCVESNGLLISIFNEDNYPQKEIDIHNGDRFIMYTDGLTEAENSSDRQFGDDQLQKVLHNSADMPAVQMSRILYTELQKWIANPDSQQDDYSWIIIDIRQ